MGFFSKKIIYVEYLLYYRDDRDKEAIKKQKQPEFQPGAGIQENLTNSPIIKTNSPTKAQP